MRHHVLCKTAAVLSLLFASSLAIAQTAPAAATATRPAAKPMELLLPTRGGSGVPANNDYSNPESDFSHKRSKVSEHFVLFWHKEYGDDPKANTGNSRFDADEIIKEVERFYTFYVDDLKWVDKEKSLATKYKFLIYIISNSNGGTAFGGSIDNKIGAFWSPASRVARGPYGVVAHELGHSFQALVRADGAAGFSGPNIGEMTSQFMLWQVYPEWLTFENYHLNDYMKATHLAFMHPDNQYHTCHIFEYWAEKRGIDIMGRLWREVQRGEDAVMAYKRIAKLNQEQFNDEVFEAERHFITWDMPRIEKVAARYANQHITTVNKAANNEGWYQIASDKVPQDYGYNAIKLQVPAPGTKVVLDFKGIAGAEGFSQTNLDKAGWRYGFLAHKEDGSRVYSDIFKQAAGKSEFTVPAGTKFLWLVVTGTPSEHAIFSAGRGGRGGGGRGGRGAATATATAAASAPAAGRAPAPVAGGPAQYPYQFKLTGTAPDDSFVR